MYFVVHFSLSIASKVDARSTSKAIGGDRAHQFHKFSKTSQYASFEIDKFQLSGLEIVKNSTLH